jgi:hypothetical protein
MTSETVNLYSFYKEDNGRWYIDLPDYQGPKADLEMVEGADKMLDYIGGGDKNVKLLLAETDFGGATELFLTHNYSEETGGGGIYLLKAYNGEQLNQEMWLCEVTEWVFGRMPEVIYFKKMD